MKKVWYLTKYADRGASSRLRSYQYFPAFEKAGYSVSYSALFGNSYLKALYSNRMTRFVYLVLAYIKRIVVACSLLVRNYDIVVVEYEIMPYFPPVFEYLLYRFKNGYIVDYDDAIFHNYDSHRLGIVKFLLGKKIDKVMKYSTIVFAGNGYLADKAVSAGAQRVLYVPTVIDLEKYSVHHKSRARSSEFILGWIGSPSTYKYFEKIIPTLYKVKEKYEMLKVIVVGAKLYEVQQDFISYVPWQESTEVDEIRKFHVGVMPLEDSLWAKGKCAYKLLQYMGCGIPVLASPIGANNDVVSNGYNGYLVSDEAWFQMIEYYVMNPDIAEQHGINGRKLIEEKYNLVVNTEMILTEFERFGA